MHSIYTRYEASGSLVPHSSGTYQCRRDQVDKITGSRALAAGFVPGEQSCLSKMHAVSSDPQSIPDTPPDEPAPALARLTPSAMALLQPGAMHASGSQQHRRMYAPPSIFPGFATLEKLQTASEHSQGQLPALGSQQDEYQHAQRASVAAQHHPRTYEYPGCSGSADMHHGPPDLQATHSADFLGKHIRSRSASEPQYGLPTMGAPAQQCSSSPLQGSRDGYPSHSPPSHGHPIHSPSRQSRDPTSLTTVASTRCRSKALSDTACQRQIPPRKPQAVGAARQEGRASSGQLSKKTQGSQESCLSPGYPGKQPAPLGSPAHARAVLQPSTGQPEQLGKQRAPPGSPAHARALLQPRTGQAGQPGQVGAPQDCGQLLPWMKVWCLGFPAPL